MAAVTKADFLAALPVGRTCGRKGRTGCGKAPLVCFADMTRGCKHFISDAGYFDLRTGEHRPRLTFAEVTRDGEHLVAIGVSQSARAHGRGVSREEGIANLRAHLAALQ